MPTKKLKDRLKELPLAYKFVGFGSVLGVVSVFLPWYLDVDKFNSGYQFLGITGPLYLIGGTLLVSFGLSATLVASRMFHKNLISLPIKEYTFNIGNAVASFYLIFIAYSIYFHPQFGLHIVDKQPRFGLLAALIACVITGYGGYLQRKQYLIAHKNARTIEEHEVVEKVVHQQHHRGHQNVAKVNVSNMQEQAVKNIRQEIHNEREPVATTVDIPIKSEIRSLEENNDF